MFAPRCANVTYKPAASKLAWRFHACAVVHRLWRKHSCLRAGWPQRRKRECLRHKRSSTRVRLDSFQEGWNKGRVELRAGAVTKDSHRFFARHGLAIGARAGHGVETIGDGEQPRQ